MKTPILYIEAKQNSLFTISKSEISKLPKEFILAYTIQYKPLALELKKQLESNDIIVSRFQQVLGCTKLKTHLPVLLVSSGKFHAENLFLQAPAIFIIENNKILKIPESEINQLKNKRTASLMNFLKSDEMGILVSTKPGQQKLSKSIKLKESLIKKEKHPYIFITDNIDPGEFENYPLNSWINTACPGLANDSPKIINLEELPKGFLTPSTKNKQRNT